ncbi:PREDICTED: uncharacterized protein LOC107329575 isoform X1 [Acropora digitifera]|uniref:uncharacterized protein LOC107329575 isoform X1 n=1 Tax=Acropora digitifera TaxID=70779 RepID=UPI00077AA857|nr:PREDICTED: uncharacterized protein LOC107329575 isoform X1 [Acropora digitifera]
MAYGGVCKVTTRGNVNFARLCRLLVDVGSEVLGSTFDRIHSPAKLSEVLSRPLVKSILLGKKGKRKLLNETQENELYPTSSNMSVYDLDITLLMILLRNICNLSPPSSTGSWDKLPPDSDNSLEANIVRIKYYRNNVYAHAKKASVDDATFEKLWLNISNAILALEESQASVIDSLKTMDMDVDLHERYERALTESVERDVSIKEEFQVVKGMVKSVKDITGKNHEESKELVKADQDRRGEELVREDRRGEGREKRHQWTHSEKVVLMECYYKSKIYGRGYMKRMLGFWNQRGMFERTENQLATQARSIEKNGYLSEEELNAIKKRVGFL